MITTMSVCPVCHNQFDEHESGQLCPKCRAVVLAKDMYTKGDLRFVGILAGVLAAAVLSMPGAFVGYVIGLPFDQASRGCTLGILVFAIAGLIAGYQLVPVIVRRME